MHITVKGQVTIPQAIRDRMGFLPGTDIEFVAKNNRVYLTKPDKSRRRGARVVSHLRGRGRVRMTTDQIMALTRGAS
jgi:AbrB family looped-hinge helix DNA binding protein